MNMLSEMFGGLIDKEKATFETIQSTLEDVAEELGCDYKDFFITIKATDEKFAMRFDIFRTDSGKPVRVREITLKEILNIEE